MIYNRIQENFCDIVDASGSYTKAYYGDELVWEKVLGNFLLYDIEREELFLTDFPLTYPKEKFYPVGIVVIPFSHNRYKTGECGVISLRYGSNVTPKEGLDNGGIFAVGVGMSQRIRKYYPEVACLGYFSDSTVSNIITRSLDLSTSGNGAIPYANARYVDSYRWKECPTDLGIYWRRPSSISGVGYAASPFLNNGGPNPLYGLSEYKAQTGGGNGIPVTWYDVKDKNCMSDFKGKENCENILQYCTANEGWQTAEVIPNTNGSSTWSPAIAACWRYSPMGTTEGDWYLPAAGEAGYIGARWDYINNWIKALQEHFEITLCELAGGYPLWTSTFYSIDKCIKLNTEGRFERQTLTTGHAVRPFMRGRWKGRKEYVPSIL